MRRKYDLCKCNVCGRKFDYDGLYSPMLEEDKWREVIKFYNLEEAEERAFENRRYNSRMDNEKAHVFLCFDCMEKAMGHKLTLNDVNKSPFNERFIEAYLK